MKRHKIVFKTIIAMIFACGLIAVNSWAFAQGSIAGSIRDSSNNRGIEGVIITISDVSTGMLAGTGITDASGNYSVVVPSPGNYILISSKTGYDNILTSGMIELSDITPNRNINIAMAKKGWLKYKPKMQTPVLNWDTGAGKSYLIPALEIPAFILALNGYNRIASPNEEQDGKKVYSVTWSTFRDHVDHGPWGFDQDAFKVNQLLHPYQGSIYYGFARSAGLNFWESSAYTFAGSFLWEMGGETTSPSINDQIASGIAGAFFGEPLFRIASLLLESGCENPGFWRELGATLISPPTGFNRLVFGERFTPVFPSHNPATFWRLRFGAFFTDRVKDQGSLSPVGGTEGTMDFSMAYGLPGKPGYDYTRPFDYFHFEAMATSNPDNLLEDVMIRGLLFGKKYEAGESYRGVWGLYGGYDYISPQIFRVSSTSASLGTTFQWWLTQKVALQGSALGGVGYGAAGNISGSGERDYHYGIAPQGLLALRLILDDKAMLDATARGYYISGMGSTETGGNETIGRLNMGLTVRIYGRHALGIHYMASGRDAHYSDRADSRQTAGTFSLVYTLLGDTKFGAVEWR
ncbi:MAG: DUF3943 domain-containing protein [Proteobacteria bacterium]|nr:DUF3943 domain-containing protein [Pseudomonadota bacterium]